MGDPYEEQMRSFWQHAQQIMAAPVTPTSLPSRDDPYDPDMTVSEALELGLIAVIDTGAMGSTYREPCGYLPDKDDQHFYCTRNRGHEGTHAYVYRWVKSHKDILREQMQRAEELRKADEERRKKQAEAAEKRQEALRQMSAVSAKNLRNIHRDLADMGSSMVKASKDMEAALKRKEDRDWSAVYGRAGASPALQYRDQNVGKIRGPRK